MTTNTQQTNGQIMQVFTDWKSMYAPYNLKEDEGTIDLLVDFVVKNYQGVVSFTALNAAAEALGEKILKPAPHVKTPDELAAEENARSRRDFMDSIKPQESFDAKVARDKAKRMADEKVKAQANAKTQIELTINGYQCYRENGAGVDFTTTEMIQKDLRTVKFGKDYLRTLVVVKRIIENLPDHPKLNDVARVVEDLNKKLK